MDSQAHIIKTPSNSYILSKDKRMIIYVHPIMQAILESQELGIDINKIAEKLNLDIDIVSYYHKKLCYYINNGYVFNSHNKKELRELHYNDVKFFFLTSPQIVFEMTEECNMACEYCIYGKHYNLPSKKNHHLKAENIITFLNDYCSKSNHINGNHHKITIGFYGGEPLLRFNEIKNVVEYFKQKNKDKFEWHITTNATLIDRDIANFFIENDFHLLISLDGNSDNNSYRVFKDGSNTFKRIMSNIETLKSLSTTFFEENVRFNAVLHNKNSVNEIYSFFLREFGKTPSIGELTTVTSNDTALGNMRKLSESDHANNLKEHFDTSPQKRAIYTFLKSNTSNFYKSFNDLIHPIIQSSNMVIPTGTCLPFAKKIFITANCEIKPCEKVPQLMGFGNITESITDVFFQKIANFYNNIYKRIWNTCNKCSACNNCPVCVFYLNSTLTKNSDIQCDSNMNTQYNDIHISSILNSLENNYNYYINCTNTLFE